MPIKKFFLDNAQWAVNMKQFIKASFLGKALFILSWRK